MNGSVKFWIRVFSKFRGGCRSVLLLLLGAYRTIGTNHLGGACRFEPSCSQYATEAVQHHPPLKALRLIASRLIKCRPGGPWGYDPVPPHQEKIHEH